ncbi:MAG: hypothetical protein V3T08_09550 [Gemmatimonadota bacterium]
MSKNRRSRIWLIHAGIAIAVTWAFSFVVPFLYRTIGPGGIAAVIAAFAYGFREFGQQIEKKKRGQPIRLFASAMDAVAPAVAAALFAWWVL